MIEHVLRVYDELYAKVKAIVQLDKAHPQPTIVLFKPVAEGYEVAGILVVSGDDEASRERAQQIFAKSVSHAGQMWIVAKISETVSASGKLGCVAFAFAREGKFYHALCAADHDLHLLHRGELVEAS